MAITAQQFCSIETAMNFLVLSGISKTAVWKKQDAADLRGNFKHAGTFPLGTPVSTTG
jgi:hypothetical protein